LRKSPDDLRTRAKHVQDALASRSITASVVELGGAVGGGACAEDALASWGVALDVSSPPAAVIAERLRSGDPPVLPRVQSDRVLFDVRTLLHGEDEPLVAAIARAVLDP
jgi:L-seryl-tRNA(Ser) seleniumtransferase